MRNRFGDWVSSSITQNSTTKEDLANRLGISTQAVSAHINGDYFPSILTIIDYSNIFNVSPRLVKEMITKDCLDRGYDTIDFVGGIYK